MAHRIDTHIHIIPQAYRTAVERIGDPSGWHVPAWTPASAKSFLDQAKIQKAVWSITSPGPAVAGSGQEVRKLVKDCNDEVAAICKADPDRFAWFASLPSFVDAQGTVEAVEYALTLDPKPSGVVTMTSYSGKLLGDPDFDAVWACFNKHKLVVFVHPSSVEISPKLIAGTLPQPTIDYPCASTRTCVDLLLRGHVRTYPNTKMIFSHAGGVLPYLWERLIESLRLPTMVPRFKHTTADQVIEDVKKMYFDVAIATQRHQLLGLLSFVDPSHILFGSDFPYAENNMILPFIARWDHLLESDKELACLKAANSENAKRLFGW